MPRGLEKIARVSKVARSTKVAESAETAETGKDPGPPFLARILWRERISHLTTEQDTRGPQRVRGSIAGGGTWHDPPLYPYLLPEACPGTGDVGPTVLEVGARGLALCREPAGLRTSGHGGVLSDRGDHRWAKPPWARECEVRKTARDVETPITTDRPDRKDRKVRGTGRGHEDRK